MFKMYIISAVIGIPLSFLFGTITPIFWVLIACMGLDLVSGIAKAIYTQSLRSREMWQGGIRKGMVFLVIILANMIDIAVMNGIPVCKTCAIFYYISMEGLSFLENLDAMQVPIPHFIKRYLLTLKQQNDEQPFGADKPKDEDK